MAAFKFYVEAFYLVDKVLNPKKKRQYFFIDVLMPKSWNFSQESHFIYCLHCRRRRGEELGSLVRGSKNPTLQNRGTRTTQRHKKQWMA